MAYDLTSVYSLLSSILSIPSAWFGFPAFITNIIIPFILMSYALYKLLERIHIFGYHTGIYAVLAVVISLFMLPAGPLIAIIAAAFLAMFGFQTWPSRIIFVVILAVIYLFAIPYLSTLRF
jgi:hypothetical protein